MMFAKKHPDPFDGVCILYVIHIEWTTLRPTGFMLNHCSLQLQFATMNQDGEVWSWTNRVETIVLCIVLSLFSDPKIKYPVWVFH